MGTLAITVGSTPFIALASAASAGRYALDFDAQPAREDITAIHLPGVKGAYTIYGEAESRVLVLRVRYVQASRANLLAAVKTDQAAFRGQTVTVDAAAGGDGGTYTRCRLASGRKVGDMRSTGRGTFRLDYEFTFICYEVT